MSSTETIKILNNLISINKGRINTYKQIRNQPADNLLYLSDILMDFTSQSEQNIKELKDCLQKLNAQAEDRTTGSPDFSDVWNEVNNPMEIPEIHVANSIDQTEKCILKGYESILTEKHLIPSDIYATIEKQAKAMRETAKAFSPGVAR